MKRFALLAALALAGCLSFHAGAMPGEPKDATFLTIDGTRVRYLDVGQGPAVVLVHGFASSLDTWALVVPALVKSGHRVLALDLKGFGWTDRPEGDYSPEAQARLVLGLMDARGVDKAALVGHSWGASVALATAIAAPARVTRLALYDAWAFDEHMPTFFIWSRVPVLGEIMYALWYDERADERIALAFYDQRFVTEALAEGVERALARPGTKAAALAATRGMHYERLQAQYKDVRQPVLLLWGREDIVTPSPYGERLLRLLPDSRMVVYPRCGHFPMLEAAAASTAELVAFLAPDRAAASDAPAPAPAVEGAR